MISLNVRKSLAADLKMFDMLQLVVVPRHRKATIQPGASHLSASEPYDKLKHVGHLFLRYVRQTQRQS